MKETEREGRERTDRQRKTGRERDTDGDRLTELCFVRITIEA